MREESPHGIAVRQVTADAFLPATHDFLPLAAVRGRMI